MNILSKVVSTAKDFANSAADVANTGVAKAQGVAGSVTDFVNDTYFAVLSRDEYDKVMAHLDIINEMTENFTDDSHIESVMAISGSVSNIRDIVSNKDSTIREITPE